MRAIGVLTTCLLATAAFTTPAHAYLDPATGSIALQLLLGGAAGALVLGKIYWAKIKQLFGGATADEPETGDKQTEE